MEESKVVSTTKAIQTAQDIQASCDALVGTAFIISFIDKESYMQISDIPVELDMFLSKLNLKKPKMCFMNCYMAVMNTLSKDEFDIHYVLGTVTAIGGHTFEHALIKWNGKYYDPTLEPQGLHRSSSYSIDKEFSSGEIIQLLKSRFDLNHIKEMIEGRKPHWPLVKTGSGTFEFKDV